MQRAPRSGPQQPKRARRAKTTAKKTKASKQVVTVVRAQRPNNRIFMSDQASILEPRMRGVQNPYLHAVLDPGGAEAIAYPDEFPRHTTPIKSKIVHDMYYFPAGNGCEPVGMFYNVTSPTLLNPILEYKLDLALGSTSNLTFVASAQTESTGLFPITEDTPSPAVTAGTMLLPSNTELNFKGMSIWADQSQAIPPFTGHRQDGSVFYGLPFYWGDGASSITVRCQSDSQFDSTGDSNIRVNIIGESAEVSTKYLQSESGSTELICTFQYADLTDQINAAKFVPYPGVGFRLSNESGSGIPFCFNSIRIEYTLPGSSLQPRFVAIDNPAGSTYSETVDQYRLIGQSSWVSYEGSDLKNGGQIASVMYRGGVSPMENQLVRYRDVSVTPGSYAGPLRKAAYSYWEPSNSNDMLMRRLNSFKRWEYPYVVNSGIVAEPEQVNALKLQVDAIYEIISNNQTWTPRECAPRPDLIIQASQALRNIPNSMENPLHLETIRRVLAQAKKFAMSAAQYAYDNRSWLVPAAQAIGTALI